MSNNLYAERDIRELDRLDGYYARHVDHMTSE